MRYRDLAPVLEGLPDRLDKDNVAVLVSDADRLAAQAELAEALADGRLSSTEYEAMAAAIQRAELRGDVNFVLADLDGRASTAERQETVRMLDAARDDGRLSLAEHADRVRQATSATLGRQVTALLSDLRQPRSRRFARMSDQDRKATAAQLKQALAEGKLDLDEYDERVRAAYRARSRADSDRLVADLVRFGVALPRQRFVARVKALLAAIVRALRR